MASSSQLHSGLHDLVQVFEGLSCSVNKVVRKPVLAVEEVVDVWLHALERVMECHVQLHRCVRDLEHLEAKLVFGRELAVQTSVHNVAPGD